MIEFTVNDMTCGHCASSITRAVKEVDSGSRCEVDRTHPAAEFKAAIEEAGFTPVG